MLDAVEIRSSASRSEISRTCSETIRSSGAVHLGGDDMSAGVEHDCAPAIAGDVDSAAPATANSEARPRRASSRRLLAASAGLRRALQNGDTTLSLDVCAECKSKDIEDAINRLARE